MTKQEFEHLSHPEQDEEVMNNGIYLINYNKDHTMCDVYRLYHFFVKFSYDLRENTKPDIIAMTGTDDCQLYENKLFPFSGS